MAMMVGRDVLLVGVVVVVVVMLLGIVHGFATFW